MLSTSTMRKGAMFLIIGVMFLLAACRGSTAASTSPTFATSTSTTASAPTSTSTTSASTPTTTATDEVAIFPVTVETDLGAVIFSERPERIVSLSATHTEILYAVGAGDQIVATDDTSNYPSAANDTEKLDSFSFNVEKVAALDPDLVIIAFDFTGEAEAMSALEIPFILLGPPDTLESALSQHLTIGAVTGHAAEADQLVTGMVAEVQRLVAEADAVADATVFHEVDSTLYSVTSDSFFGDLYRQLGLVNIADTATATGPFPQLTAEFIVDQDPEFIFLADSGFGVTIEAVADRPGWGAIRAVANQNVVPLDGDIAGRWGPRTPLLMASILEAVEAGTP